MRSRCVRERERDITLTYETEQPQLYTPHILGRVPNEPMFLKSDKSSCIGDFLKKVIFVSELQKEISGTNTT